MNTTYCYMFFMMVSLSFCQNSSEEYLFMTNEPFPTVKVDSTADYVDLKEEIMKLFYAPHAKHEMTHLSFLSESGEELSLPIIPMDNMSCYKIKSRNIKLIDEKIQVDSLARFLLNRDQDPLLPESPARAILELNYNDAQSLHHFPKLLRSLRSAYLYTWNLESIRLFNAPVNDLNPKELEELRNTVPILIMMHEN